MSKIEKDIQILICEIDDVIYRKKPAHVVHACSIIIGKIIAASDIDDESASKIIANVLASITLELDQKFDPASKEVAL